MTAPSVPAPTPQPRTAGPGLDIYAGFWRRVFAYLIDSAVLVLASSAIMTLATANPTGSVGALVITDAIWSLIVLFLSSLYPILMECSPLQATVGKLVAGLKVTDLQGARISFGRSFWRTSAHILSELTLGIGLVMCIFTRYRQCLHDRLAGTLVVRRQYSPLEIATAGPAPEVSVAAITLIVVGVLLVAMFGLGVLAGILVPLYQSYVLG
ncbi:MAG: RDD family protein [Sinobacteraceae bacterium]|nr:RDD family protein [Nevskiaceae bacterium]